MGTRPRGLRHIKSKFFKLTRAVHRRKFLRYAAVNIHSEIICHGRYIGVMDMMKECCGKRLWCIRATFGSDPLHGGSKNFFLCKVFRNNSNKTKFDFLFSQRTFSGFSTFNTRNVL